MSIEFVTNNPRRFYAEPQPPLMWFFRLFADLGCHVSSKGHRAAQISGAQHCVQKRCYTAPFYTLGPLTAAEAAGQDAAPKSVRPASLQRSLCSRNHDHITSGIGAAMIGDYPANRSPAFRLFPALLARRFGEVFVDRQEQEKIVRASQLDWTVLKPPRLTNGPRTDRVRMGTDLRVGMLSKISRADLAVAILNELGQPRFLHQAVFLKSA